MDPGKPCPVCGLPLLAHAGEMGVLRAPRRCGQPKASDDPETGAAVIEDCPCDAEHVCTLQGYKAVYRCSGADRHIFVG